MEDQFAYWKTALAAKQANLEIPRERFHDGQPQKPECGYYRRRTSQNGKPCWEAIAFYRDQGDIVCERQFGPLPKDLDEQVALFASVWDQPVAYQLYINITRNGAKWPDEIDAFGLPEIEDETPGIGHNQPPEKTEIQRVLAQFESREAQIDAWLKEHPDPEALDRAEADLLSRYVRKFGDAEGEVDRRRKELVEPHLKAQREINDAWIPLVDRYKAKKKQLADIWGTWLRGAERKAAEAARKANEDALRLAEEERKKREAIDGPSDEPAAPIQLVQPAKITGAVGTRLSARSRTVWIIDDLPALASYLANLKNPPDDFVKACQAYANRHGAAVELPGVSKEKKPHVA